MAKTTKKAETVAAKEVKETKTVETKPVEAKAAETKAPEAKAVKAPRAPRKTAAAKTTAAKAPGRKPAAAKSAAVKVIFEYHGVQVSQDDIVAAVKADWKGAAVKTLEIYVKPEDAAAYYVVNGTEGGKVSL